MVKLNGLSFFSATGYDDVICLICPKLNSKDISKSMTATKPNDLPNIFSFSGKELSHDAFFAWLASCASERYASLDPQLSHVARNFIKFLLGTDSEITFGDVNPHRQWNKADLLIEVWGIGGILIENKTNSSEHSDQLHKYKSAFENWKKNKAGYNHFAMLYIKTGVEAEYSLNGIRHLGYRVIDREELLAFFQSQQTDNLIVNHFTDYLRKIDTQHSLDKVSRIEGNVDAMHQLVKEIADDFSVRLGQPIKFDKYHFSNYAGMWYFGSPLPNFLGLNSSLFIEFYWKKPAKINTPVLMAVKMKDHGKNRQNLSKVANLLVQLAPQYDLQLGKIHLGRLSGGQPIVYVLKPFGEVLDDRLDIEVVKTNLKNLERLLTAFSNLQEEPVQ